MKSKIEFICPKSSSNQQHKFFAIQKKSNSQRLYKNILCLCTHSQVIVNVFLYIFETYRKINLSKFAQI